MKAISIILPVYNVAPYILKCLGSISMQTFRDFSLILVDDCGSDNSIALATSFLSVSGMDYTIIRNPENAGVAASRNAGLKAARSAYVLFVDPDDEIEKTMLESLYRAAVDNNADIVACNGVEFWEQESVYRPMPSLKGAFSSRQYLIHLFNGDTTAHTWLRMVKKELYDGIFFPTGVIFEDFLTVPLLIGKANRIVHLDKVLYHYVQRSDGSNLTASALTAAAAFIRHLRSFSRQMQDSLPPADVRYLIKYEYTLLAFILSRLLRSQDKGGPAKQEIAAVRSYISLNHLFAIRPITHKKAWLLLLAARLAGGWGGKLLYGYQLLKR